MTRQILPIICLLISLVLCTKSSNSLLTYSESSSISDAQSTSAAVPTPSVIPEECKKSTFVIESAADCKQIQACSQVQGNVEVRGFADPLLVLDMLQSVKGTLSIVSSPNLVRIEAPQVTSISQSFKMEKLTSLALVHMPELASVSALEWRVLPILGNVNFGHIEGLETIIIADTSLTGVSGFSSRNLKSLDINNNRFLESIKSDVQHISEYLHIAANADNVVVDLKSLMTTHNMSIHNVASLDIGNLEEVKGSINVISNQFQEIIIPKLKSVGGTFSVAKNEYLDTVELSSLAEVGGGLLIIKNPFLSIIDFFPRLSIIGGALELVGNIKLVAWKNLKLVKGSAKVVTSDSSFDCASWKLNDAGKVVRGGKVECSIAELGQGDARIPVPGKILQSDGEVNLAHLAATLGATLVGIFLS